MNHTYLVRDDAREIYDLGKGTYDWPTLIATPETSAGASSGHPFRVDPDADRVASDLRRNWEEESGGEADPRYFLLVARDVIRWSTGAEIRQTDEGSFDGWRVLPGRQDDGQKTGSRHSNDHPEWPPLD